MSKADIVVLLIDDEPRIRRFLHAGFELHGGFSVIETSNALDALKLITFNSPDIILLDLKLPDLHGAEVLERIRSWSDVPVIILSADANESQKVRLFGAGADDYVTKPFGIAELISRCEAAHRRYHRTEGESSFVITGPLKIDLINRRVTLDGHDVKLARKEYRLLQLLARHAGMVVTHDRLMKDIWVGNRTPRIQYLRILVRKLRQKIEVDHDRPQLLVTESGVGYRLRSEVDSTIPNGSGESKSHVTRSDEVR